jgi:hypothetical protein
MLRNERRSNFRDECLQHFGKDNKNREGMFEEESNKAEMRFATLAPPEPSLLRPAAPVAPPTAGGYGGPPPMAAAPPPVRTVLPDEFMRGGGCFGPNATVQLVGSDGSLATVPVHAVRAGDMLLADGGVGATVRCVVLTECAGGRAELTRLRDGAELTPWHPLRDPTGRWRFPHMLGTSVLVQTSHVYNFVLTVRDRRSNLGDPTSGDGRMC